MATQTQVCDFGRKAVDFDLPGTDGKRHTLASVRGPKGLVVMFICNHCPYVKAIRERIVRDCRELAAHGIGAVAIMANDPADYPEDSFENMQRVARELAFPFPYVLDESRDRAGVRRRLHAGILRLQRRSRAPVHEAARRFVDRPCSQRAPRAPRGDDRRSANRQRPGRTDRGARLLDQVEAGLTRDDPGSPGCPMQR
jgi:peroxiredoxin